MTNLEGRQPAGRRRKGYRSGKGANHILRDERTHGSGAIQPRALPTRSRPSVTDVCGDSDGCGNTASSRTHTGHAMVARTVRRIARPIGRTEEHHQRTHPWPAGGVTASDSQRAAKYCTSAFSVGKLLVNPSAMPNIVIHIERRFETICGSPAPVVRSTGHVVPWTYGPDVEQARPCAKCGERPRRAGRHPVSGMPRGT